MDNYESLLNLIAQVIRLFIKQGTAFQGHCKDIKMVN